MSFSKRVFWNDWSKLASPDKISSIEMKDFPAKSFSTGMETVCEFLKFSKFSKKFLRLRPSRAKIKSSFLFREFKIFKAASVEVLLLFRTSPESKSIKSGFLSLFSKNKSKRAKRRERETEKRKKSR